MDGGRFEVALVPVAAPASYGAEQVEFRVAGHPKQPLGPLARVASGGELSRIALAVQVVASEAGAVPTLIFDEVDSGIGGAVAGTVGRLMQTLAARRQVLTRDAPAAGRRVRRRPLPGASSSAMRRAVRTDGRRELDAAARVEELARMLAGSAITAKTRAHARELFEQHRRRAA